MKLQWAVGLCGAFLSCAMSPVLAADGNAEGAEIPPAPLSKEQPEEGESHYFATAYAFNKWDGGLIGQEQLLRRAEPKMEPHTIWKLSDIAIAARFESADQPRDRTMVSLVIGVEGQVTSCSLDEERKGEIVLAAQICPVIKERFRFTPAIALDGSAAEDYYSYTIYFAHQKKYRDNVPRAFQPIPLVPTPQPTPDVTKASEWPILRDGYPGFRATTAKRPIPLAPLALETNEKVAGIAFSRTKDDETDCVVVVPSGDVGLDQSACDHVRNAHDPRLELPRYGKTTMPYLVVGVGKAEQAYAPVSLMGAYASIDENTAELTRDRIEAEWAGKGLTGVTLDRLSFALALDDKGLPTDCRIRASSGSDAGDVLACEVLKETIRFKPAKDIFGRSVNTRDRGWFAKRRR